jgi:ferredoxin
VSCGDGCTGCGECRARVPESSDRPVSDRDLTESRLRQNAERLKENVRELPLQEKFRLVADLIERGHPAAIAFAKAVAQLALSDLAALS